MEAKPLRSADIRARNEKLVLSLIRRQRGISQSQVAQLTGLKPPTVFRIFQVLEEQGFISNCVEDPEKQPEKQPERQPPAQSDWQSDRQSAVPSDTQARAETERPDGERPETERPGSERKGRRPAYYCVNPHALYVVGVDFWARSASAVVVDFAGTPVYRDVLDLNGLTGVEEILERLEALITEAIDQAGIDRERLLGIGVGAPGMVDIETGVVLRYPRIEGMDGFPLRERLEEAFGVPVHLHNNAAVIALSEYRYGSVRGRRSVLTLVLRAGVGGAFIQNGSLFVNHHRTALEVGHVVVDPAGPECRCGRRGCLETYLSEEVLRRQADVSTVDELFARLAAGDREVVRHLDDAKERLITAVYSLLNTLNPEAILIVTRSQVLSEELCDALRDSIASVQPFAAAAERDIVPHEYDPVIAGQGAADLVFDGFFSTVGG